MGCPQPSQLWPGHLCLWGGTSPRGASRTRSGASCLRRAAGLGLAPSPDAGRPPDSPFWLSLPAHSPSHPEWLPEGTFQSKGQMADLVTPAPAPKPANDVQLRGWPARPFTTIPENRISNPERATWHFSWRYQNGAVIQPKPLKWQVLPCPPKSVPDYAPAALSLQRSRVWAQPSPRDRWRQRQLAGWGWGARKAGSMLSWQPTINQGWGRRCSAN